MRVIAGKYRGKKLKEFDLNSTKPTLDRVKEAFFSSIQFDIVGSTVLDLFSGTGALGIEAISRGAKLTYLVEKEIKAIKIIKANLSNITEDYKLINDDYMAFLEKNKNTKFDVVLLDPPYATDYGIKAIEFLVKNDMIAPKGVIVFETALDTNFNFENECYKLNEKKYGNIKVYFLRKLN